MRVYYQTRENFKGNRISGNLVNVGLISFNLDENIYKSIKQFSWRESDTNAKITDYPRENVTERTFKDHMEFSWVERQVLDLINSSNARGKAYAAYVVIDSEEPTPVKTYSLSGEVYAFIW